MIKKGQMQKTKKGKIISQVAFIAELFGMAVEAEHEDLLIVPTSFSRFFCNTAAAHTALSQSRLF